MNGSEHLSARAEAEQLRTENARLQAAIARAEGMADIIEERGGSYTASAVARMLRSLTAEGRVMGSD